LTKGDKAIEFAVMPCKLKLLLLRFHYHARRYTARTQQHYAATLARFARFVPSDFTEIRPAHILAYVDSILVSCSNRTANSQLTAIKSFCRWASAVLEVPNPAEKIKMLKEAPPRQRVFTEEEYHKLLSVAKPCERQIIQLFANTGLRVSELLSLGPQSIINGHIVITGKGRKRRAVPINQTVRRILRSDPLFKCKRAYSRRQSIENMIARLCRKAHIPRGGPHAIRHFFCTQLIVKHGVPVSKVSRLLGHSSIRTTEKIYTHWLESDLDGLTDVLE